MALKTPLSIAVFLSFGILGLPAIAQSSPPDALTPKPMAQVTSVSQLTDVQPTDWAFQALQSLVERYGCIAGYPDKTFRGNRAITRYEFAAGLNACLDRVNELIGAATSDLVKKEDLATFQKLQEEFATELAALRGRVDNLEARTTTLEKQQFSTTTKLSGIGIVGVQGRIADRADVAPRDGIQDTNYSDTNLNVSYLSQLLLSTQFSPRSSLLVGLISANQTFANRLTNDALLGFEYGGNGSLKLNALNYRHLVTDKLAILAGTAGVDMVNTFRGPNRFESAATGPISFFAQRNPILNIGMEGAGIGFDWQFAKRASLQAVFTSGDFITPEANQRLFSGKTTTGVQLLLTPADTVDLSLYYVNSYSPQGFLFFGTGDAQLTVVNPVTQEAAPLQTNGFGASVNWQVSPKLSLGAWGGYTNSRIPGESGNVETVNYMAYLNFPDLFKRGNLGGIYIGQPPKITNSTLPVGNNIPDFLNTGLGRSGGQPGTTLHLEAFYRMQLSDNVSLTPGIVHLVNPGHTPDNDSITIGVLRTSFLF